MSANQLVQKFVTEDGRQFDTKAEAIDYLRLPLITAALNKVNGNNKELTDWLIANQEAVESTFESTKIQRVTKSEKNQLAKALDAVAAAGDKQFKFIVENKDAILESFRWPSVKRGTDEEQAATIRGGFLALTGENAELSDWLIANQEALLEAFQAGVIKREVNPKAADALAAYRAKQAGRKAEKDAAVATLEAKLEADKAAAGDDATKIATLEAAFKVAKAAAIAPLDAKFKAEDEAVEAAKKAEAEKNTEKK